MFSNIPSLYIGKRAILALPVKCNISDWKCEWVGTFGTLREHEKVCKSLLCPQKCRDSSNSVKSITRKDLKKHLERECPNREHECMYCGEKSTYAIMRTSHDETCKKKVLRCLNTMCNETMERERLDEHVRNDCGYTVIRCKYKEISCDMLLKRHDMLSHEMDNDRDHLHMALDCVLQLKKTVASLEERSTTLKHGESITLKLRNFEEKRLNSEAFRFNPFYAGPCGYHMAITVYANGFGYSKGKDVSVYVCILKGKHDRELNWPFTGIIAVRLLNQLADENHHTNSIDVTIQMHDVYDGTSRGCAKFIPHSALGHDSDKNVQYLKDNTLYFRVSVLLPSNKPWLE